MIRTQRRAGPIAGFFLALAFAAALLPIATAERLLNLDRPFAAGDVAPMTVRLPDSGTLRDPVLAARLGAGRILAARGEVLDGERAALANEVHARALRGTARIVGLGIAFALIGLLLCAYMRTSHRGRLLRRQITLLVTFVILAAGVKAALLLTSVSWFAMPTGAFALLAVVLIDRYAGFGTAVALGFVATAVMPFDASVAIVLGAQGLGAVVAFKNPKKRASFLLAGVVAGLAATAAYVASAYVYGGGVTIAELTDLPRSSLLGALAGGLVSGPLAIALRATVERLGGEIPRSRLVELSDLDHPLLKKIAASSPGTWQHSLAMANMAEIAANSIGANALLVRVGAYYHDLGKSLQPQYYIENLAGGETSPHDELPPETSADAIFAHVTEGVRLAREHGLPTAVTDFMHMHHGDGVLEYFWQKCLEQGNPNGLTAEAFRYPGVKPQTRETAILAICDAVEAASRTIARNDTRAVQQLVQRIVYGKLHLGQLDEAGISVTELMKVANSLVDTVTHANHGRIEYPWQREERRLAAASEPVIAVGAARPATRTETSGRFVLDSADAPRPRAKPTT
jgi:cyclic-di-AMP phosphodiesterase PgpH